MDKMFFSEMINEMKMLDINGKPIPFNLEYRTFNDNNKQGGYYRIYSNCRILVKERVQKQGFNPKNHFWRSFRKRVNPNHWDNYTLNFELENGQIIKVKLKYIIKINGKEVVY